MWEWVVVSLCGPLMTSQMVITGCEPDDGWDWIQLWKVRDEWTLVFKCSGKKKKNAHKNDDVKSASVSVRLSVLSSRPTGNFIVCVFFSLLFNNRHFIREGLPPSLPLIRPVCFSPAPINLRNLFHSAHYDVVRCLAASIDFSVHIHLPFRVFLTLKSLTVFFSASSSPSSPSLPPPSSPSHCTCLLIVFDREDV